MKIYLRDLIKNGVGSEVTSQIDINDQCSVEEFLKRFDYSRFFIVVNDILPQYTDKLREGDTVTLMPILDGG